MYLTPADIEATLTVIQLRSAASSQIAIAYFQPARILSLVGWFVRRLGEPLRSTQTAPQMRALLAKYGFAVQQDHDLPTVGKTLGPGMEMALRRLKHLRIALATRRG